MHLFFKKVKSSQATIEGKFTKIALKFFHFLNLAPQIFSYHKLPPHFHTPNSLYQHSKLLLLNGK